jgi:hypothetical protein
VSIASFIAFDSNLVEIPAKKRTQANSTVRSMNLFELLPAAFALEL